MSKPNLLRVLSGGKLFGKTAGQHQLPIKSEPHHNYDPIPEGDYIRYLVLEPGSGEEALHCTLHTTSLANLPFFESVSYTWGEGAFVHSVYCHGGGGDGHGSDSAEMTGSLGVIRVGANLRDALRRIRLPDKRRTLWVDSICINQRDNDEKSRQVALMGKLYLRANRTLIYLGPNDSDHHGKQLESLIADVNTYIDAQIRPLDHAWDTVPPLASDDPWIRDPRWPSYRALTECSWFLRTWVVQEAGLATDAQLLFGASSIPWRRLMRVQRWLCTRAQVIWHLHSLYLPDSGRPELWRTEAEIAERNDGLEFWRVGDSTPTLVGVLSRAKALGCKEPVDRVYAFLGSPSAMVGPRREVIVYPDYSRSHLDVYKEFTIRWLREVGDLSILSAVSHTALGSDDIPSWVPRWDVITVSDELGLHGHDTAFDACLGAAAPPILLTPAENPTKLQLRGYIVDTVSFCSGLLLPKQEPGYPSDPIPYWKMRIHFLWLWFRTIAFAPIAYPRERRLWAFCRALSFSRPEDAKAYTADEAAFSSWVTGLASGVLAGGADRTAISAAAEESDTGSVLGFLQTAQVWARGRRFITTATGQYGIAPMVVMEGDVCCVLRGLRMPVILRPTGQEGHYRLVGETFIVGIMQGEPLAEMDNRDEREVDIIIC